MPHDVFISHASKDVATAQAVLQTLEARGVRCWIAPRDILPGREWEPSIMAALASARAVVLVFSGAANASAHVRREVAAAADARVPVIPYRVDRAEMEQAFRYYLAGVHWLDAVSGPAERNLAALADTVDAMLERDAPPAEGSPPLSGGVRPKAGRGSGAKSIAGLVIAALLIAGALIAAFLTGPQARPDGTQRVATTPRPSTSAAPRPAPPPPHEAEPEALVRRLYAQGADATAALPAVFTPDVAAAQAAAGLRGRRDWRYPGDDRPDFADLTFTGELHSDRTAGVRVQWGSWPRSRDVSYDLCRRPDGRWRVADVRQSGDSLRRTRSLPPPDPLGGC